MLLLDLNSHKSEVVQERNSVLFLFSDDKLKVTQCQITSKTKKTNILKFQQDYSLSNAYWFVYSLNYFEKCFIFGTAAAVYYFV